MRNHTRTLTVLAITIASAACHESLSGPKLHDPHAPEPGLGSEVLQTADPSGLLPPEDRRVARRNRGGPDPRSGWGTADLVSFEDPFQVVGSSRMKRLPGDVRVSVVARGLEPGSASTLWAVVFNNPEACVGECDDPDLFDNPATEADLLYVAGALTDARGRAHFSGGIHVGDVSASIMPLFDLEANGIGDSETAEIHLVIRSHGQAIPGLVQAQLSTFNGGCTGFGPEFGAPGPNECTDLYFSSHYAS